jgi:hypothetical protein
MGPNNNELGGAFPLAVGPGANIHSICTDFVTKGFYSGSPLGMIAAIPTEKSLASELQGLFASRSR